VESTLVGLVREAVLLVLTVSAPPLLAALAVGVGVGVVQAATQVQEPSIGVVPRIAVVLAALGLAGPWIGWRIVHFAASCIELAQRASS
jgi:type III secretion protein S